MQVVAAVTVMTPHPGPPPPGGRVQENAVVDSSVEFGQPDSLVMS
jgi:hypothetical protein